MVTVDKALKRGHLIVNVPVFIIMLGVIGLSLFLSIKKLAPNCVIPAGLLLGPLIGWIYWSFAITRWRIWAFTNVDDVHKLKSRAVSDKLIWPDGSIFEKTEIRTRRDREILSKLESKFTASVHSKPVTDDPTIPSVTEVFYSKKTAVIETLLMSVCLSYGIYLIATTERWIFGSLCSIVGGYFVIRNFKKITNIHPQLVLDKKGIRIKDQVYAWSETRDIAITKSANAWLTFHTDKGTINVTIDDLDISYVELERRVNVYLFRFDNATATSRAQVL